MFYIVHQNRNLSKSEFKNNQKGKFNEILYIKFKLSMTQEFQNEENLDT